MSGSVVPLAMFLPFASFENGGLKHTSAEASPHKCESTELREC